MMYFFFFNDTATTEIYTLSLHDALPICVGRRGAGGRRARVHEGSVLAAPDCLPPPRRRLHRRASAAGRGFLGPGRLEAAASEARSEEHTSELQSRQYLVCRLLLEKKNTL